MQTYRQGDVLLVAIDSIPDDVKLKRTKRVILAEGEVTGHHHVLAGNLEVGYAEAEVVYARIMAGAPAKVTHEEHATLTPPPGNYRIVRQREYSPEEVRRVAD